MGFIYLFRHGETLANKNKVLQGFENSELTDEGKKKLIKVGKNLRDVDFKKIYVSNIKRTKESAHYFMEGLGRELPVIIEPLLNERCWGNYENKQIPETFFEQFTKYDPYFVPSNIMYNFDYDVFKIRGFMLGSNKGIEPKENFFNRGKKALEKLIEEDSIVAVFSHDFLISSILNSIKYNKITPDKEVEFNKTKNGGYHVIAYTNKVAIDVNNLINIDQKQIRRYIQEDHRIKRNGKRKNIGRLSLRSILNQRHNNKYYSNIK